MGLKIFVYEKILDKYQYQNEIWDQFIDFLTKNNKNSQDNYQFFRRAAKNIPKDLNFVRGYLRALEKK